MLITSDGIAMMQAVCIVREGRGIPLVVYFVHYYLSHMC